mgnify:CR=1 FL=1
MAFIDWLRKQHADSLRASQRMAADPYLKGMQPGANVAPAPAGAIPFQRTKPGFFARDYKKEDLVDNTLTIKNDGSETLVRKWKDPDQSALRVSGLGGSGGSHPVYQQPWLVRQAYFDNVRRNQGLRDMVSAQEEGLHRAPPEMVSRPDISNQRAPNQRAPARMRGSFSIPQQTQRNIWGSRFVPNPASMIRKDRSSLDDLPVGMDEEQWKFILNRVYGRNY